MSKKMEFKSARGFSLVEAITVIAFFVFLEFGLATLIVSINKNYNQQSLALSNADKARKVTFNFTSEIRNATSGNDGAYPISYAGNNEITFYSSADLDSAIVKKIRYYLSGTTLYKSVITPTGSPLSYNATPIISSVQTNMTNGTTGVPIFYYYDSNYDGNSNQMSQPININQIKFVKINLVVSLQVGQNTSSFTVDAGANLRNLKTNLGN